MKFEVDVSGQDIFLKDYVICICSEEEKIIKGFKFNQSLINDLVSNWKKNKYKYGVSKKQLGLLKVRIYCIIIYYLFKSINPKPERISLTICRDFAWHKNDINQNLKYFLGKILSIEIGNPLHQKLPKKSKAHWYAYLMLKDTENLLSTYINISLEDIEEYLVPSKGHRPKP